MTCNGVFAGGRLRVWTRLIIDSVADGKRAAMGIDEFLRLHRSRELPRADSGDGKRRVCRLRVRRRCVIESVVAPSRSD